MPAPGERRPPLDPTGWMPTFWTMVVVLAAVTAAALALPSLPEYTDEPVTARDVFHPEWLITATLVVLPLYRATRMSWGLALFVVPVACLHVLYIVDTAIDASRQAGLADGVSVAWYAVAFAQIGLFAVVGAVGAFRNVADRRFARMMRSMTGMTFPASHSLPDKLPDGGSSSSRPPRSGSR
jgi:hypothetical protein